MDKENIKIKPSMDCKKMAKMNLISEGLKENVTLKDGMVMPGDSKGVITVDLLDSNGEKGRYNDSKSEKIRKKIRTYVRIELT